MGRTYGQFCGLARAADALGERWALLVVRDLLVSPKRFGELREGLAGIPTNVLTTRLRQLEDAGIVQRSLAAAPSRAVHYELTAYGADLRDVILALARWGARRMAVPEPGEIVTNDSLASALWSAFQPDSDTPAASYELNVGDTTAHAVVDGPTIRVGGGPLPAPDLRIHATAQIRAVLAGRLRPTDALRSGAVRIEGPRNLFDHFVTAFRVPLDDHMNDTPAST